MSHLLDNITWHTLVGPHARFAVGTDAIRRYAPGLSPIVGFVDANEPDWGALERFCAPEDQLYCDGWSGAPRAPWRVTLESTMFRMIWAGELPDDDATEAVRLGPEHAAQALALATLTRPGPFGPRTMELGEYFGCFDGDRLVAMAGERMHAGRYREISGVCTHPDFAGRGLARRLMRKLILRECRRGQVPFLHVMRDNARARELYRRLGFRTYMEVVVRVVTAA
jgi:ribosomal protein S18 acetylase RimI-like enzyme